MVAANKENLEHQKIAEQVARILLSATQFPKFPKGNVPVKVAAAAFGKSDIWVRERMKEGRLDIGIITEGDSRSNVYISPKKLWEMTGYLWEGEE